MTPLQFKAVVEPYILAAGGVPIRTFPGSAQYEINTKAGKLRIEIYADWIAARFEDAAAGEKLVGCPVSGKWNHYPGEYRDRGRAGVAAFAKRFGEELAKIAVPSMDQPQAGDVEKAS